MPKKPSKVAPKLPKGHPQRAKPKKRKRNPRLPEKAFENAPSPEAEAFARLMNVPVDKLNNPLMTGMVGHYVRVENGEPEPETTLTTFPPLEVARAIPCGEDTTLGGTFPFVWVDCSGITLPPLTDTQAPSVPLPPDTSSYPWPLKVLWWLDTPVGELWTRFRSRLAQWVTPK